MPDWKEHIRRSLAGLPFEGARELEITEEISQYLDDLHAESLAAGADEDEAARIVLAELERGDLLREGIRRAVKHPLPRCIATAGLQPIPTGKEERRSMFAAFAQDLRFALRMLRKQPAFSAVAILTLALGIGANTAVFSAVNALLLHPLPYPDPDRILFVDARHINGRNSGAGYRDFLDWRAQNVVFEEMAIADGSSSVLVDIGEPRRVPVGVATEGFLRVLGVRPVFGRFFTGAEDRPGAPRVAVLSHAAWQRYYAGRSDALGKTLSLDGVPHTVIGIMPSGLVLPGMPTCDLWVPLREDPANGRLQHQYSVAARLKSGITVARAQADMSAIATRLAEQYPETNKGWGIQVIPAAQGIAGMAGTPLAVLFATVVFVLLLCCSNVAALLLARGAARSKEMAVRAAHGASRRRVAGQMLTESLLLATFAGGIGILVARWLMNLMRLAAPQDLGLDSALRMDATVLSFAFAVSVLTGIGFGMAPAWFGAKTDLNLLLKGETRQGTRSRGRLISAVVGGQIALASVLLTGAGLLVKDFFEILRIDAGVDAEHVLTCALEAPASRYPTGRSAVQFYGDLLERVRTMPDVRSAAAVSTLPMTGMYSGGGFEIEGRRKPADWTDMNAQHNVSTPGYFRTMGIPLKLGRDFDERDAAAAAQVAIVNDIFVRRYFRDEDPIAKRIRYDGGSWRTIVGVTGSVKHQRPTREPVPMVYVPLAQAMTRNMWLTVKTEGLPARLAGALRSTVRALDSEAPVERMRTMQQVIEDSLVDTRIIAAFVAGFAWFALCLAGVGIYGVIAYSVSQRNFEIGVRLAVGATRADVCALVLKRGASLAAAGIAIGVPAAFGLSRFLASLLYGVSPHDIAVFAAVPLLLLIVALAASYIPARRASRIDPNVALRAE